MSDALVGIDELYERLVGHRLPGGSFQVAEYERWISHQAMLSPALPDRVLHPVWMLLGALRGMGVTMEDLLALASQRPEDGVLFGETTMRQFSTMSSDVTYYVTGEITSITRRSGKRAGLMDLMTFVLNIGGAGSAPVASVSQTFVITRKDQPNDR